VSDPAVATPRPDVDAIARLERWYLSMCDGDWEHTYGLTIETLDNPGWIVSIEVKDTPLFDMPFDALRRDLAENDWIQCGVADGVWRGTCSVGRLVQLLEMFLAWAERQE
jgi:hypothetical protein